MFFALIALLVLGVTGDSFAGPPDVKGFTPVLSKELEFRIDDYRIAFVGQVVDYQNPNDPNEFVRVYYRQVAIISERAKENDSKETGSLDRNSSNLNYHLKQETEALSRVQQATDAFAYVQWRTVQDPRTGQNIRTDLFRSWLLGQNGNWMFSYGDGLFVSPFSEESTTNPDKRIIVGIKFVLVDGVHIVRIDQDDIMIQSKEAVDDKK